MTRLLANEDGPACSLCRPDLGPVVSAGPYWRLVVNRNQNFLGQCFWVLRRHCEVLPDLAPDEWHDLYSQIHGSTAALTRVFQPNHFKYAFL